MIAKLLKRFGPSETTIGRYLLTAMAIGFGALTLAIIAAVWVTQRNQAHTAWVDHTYQVEGQIARLRALTEQAETARRGYLLMPTQAMYIASYHRAADAVPATIDKLAQLTIDNPVERANIASLRHKLAELGAQRDLTIRLAARGRIDEAIASFRHDSASQRMIHVRALLTAMEAEEHNLLDRRDIEQQASARLFYVVLAVAALLLLLVAAVSLVTVLRFTRDLTASRDTLRQLNDSLEDVVQERTADLSRANEEIQRFAYIVSHDLRAPLVNVMGFTAELDTATREIAALIDRAEQSAPELLTEDVRLAAREDLPEAIGFIRSSSEKMDRLINAILKLSREGRRVLAPERIDMARMVTGIGDSLKHRLDETGTELRVDAPLPEIVSDRLAIEQILSNLIENAVKYLQPGRPGRIVVRGTRTGPRVAYEIEDNGRGIAASDHERVFDLFRRAGHQDQPGEGIGLAHVRALAYRLGGIIDVRSELGTGSVFRLTLPIRLTEFEEDRA